LAKQILIIDDEPDVVKMVVIRLRARGYKVSLAVDGKEGLAALETQRPDLILLDYRLPDIAAPTLARKIKAREGAGQIPIILITASSEGLSEKTKDCLAADYLLKPIAPEELYEKIGRCLGPLS
jgi:CheY-like chemotaxis protein